MSFKKLRSNETYSVGGGEPAWSGARSPVGARNLDAHVAVVLVLVLALLLGRRVLVLLVLGDEVVQIENPSRRLSEKDTQSQRTLRRPLGLIESRGVDSALASVLHAASPNKKTDQPLYSPLAAADAAIGHFSIDSHHCDSTTSNHSHRCGTFKPV